MDITREEAKSQASAAVILFVFFVLFVFASSAYRAYENNQPFKVTNFIDQSSGNNQITVSSNKLITNVVGWIEKDGKKVYEETKKGYTEDNIHVDPIGAETYRFTVYVPYSEELPQPGRYYMKLLLETKDGEKHTKAFEVSFHDQIKKL